MEDLVFVYGTLKQGYGNHIRLERSEFIGDDSTEDAVFDLRCWGGFPAVYKGGVTKVKGEVYRVDERTMQSLDSLEGFPDFYNREKVNLESGIEAWIYFIPDNTDRTGEPCPTGEWHGYKSRM
jgi:gamma-glutamylcyclotransferase (GGCT)/AIG2-like uncharacterized protein YtfP